MTTFVNFAPSSSGPFTFQPTLDGQIYTATVTWSVFSQRFFLNLYSLDGSLIVCRAMVGSTTLFPTASLSWNEGAVTVATAYPHGFQVGSVVNLAIKKVSPSGYNGWKTATILSPDSFSYPVETDPGQMSAAGFYGPDVNLVAGYFSDSSLVYRPANMQFEIDP